MTTVGPIRVAHVLWSGDVGGVERLVHDLCREQIRRGVEASVALAQARGPFVTMLAEADVPTHDLRLASGYDLRPSRLRLASRVLARTEVIHLHAFNAPLALSAVRARRPLLFTEHGYTADPRLRPSGLRATAPEAAKQRLKRCFLRRRAAVVATNSVYTAELVDRLYGVSRERIEVVPNGVDFEHFAPRSQGRPDTPGLTAVFVGRLAAFKRVDRVIDAVARAKVPGGLRVMIVGGGPLEGELRDRVRARGVDQLVHFLGYRSEVADLLQSADVLILPSQGEPFGLAIVEACACGALAVVFGDGGGALEVLPPDGRIVESVDALAALLSELPGSAALSSAARDARSAWARKRFPIARTAARYLELYRAAQERAAT